MRGHTGGVEGSLVNAGTQLQRTQWFQKNLQCHEAAIILARNAKRHPRHCKKFHQCSQQNQGTGEIGFDHFNIPSLRWNLFCMDLVGPISSQTSKGNRYMLTVIDMLTGYTIAVAIPDKRAETVCKAYRDHVYCTFGGSSRILTDNGAEFRSKEMKQICEDLDIKQVFSPVYTPQAMGG